MSAVVRPHKKGLRVREKRTLYKLDQALVKVRIEFDNRLAVLGDDKTVAAATRMPAFRGRTIAIGRSL